MKMVAPANAILGMDLMLNYAPREENISAWHTVHVRESFQTIASKYAVPVRTLIEFNFPGSVINGRVDPAIVNWYLYNHERFRCRVTTQDGVNYTFRGGEKIAIPYLGEVEIGQPDIIRSRNTRFKIRMHANLNVSMYAAGDFSIFEIWDEKAKLCSFYTYWAGGLAGGIPRVWLSATFKGPWNDLEVTKAIGANQFSGPARFTSGGGGSVTKNYLNLMRLPLGAETIPNPLPINTGFTLGIGAGTTIGKMELFKAGEPDGLLPFKGP